MKQLWNERFADEKYAYGKQPNQFFKKELDKLPPGKLLLLGEGEGRNGVYAASKGWEVDAVDWSETGKVKAEKLASENNVQLNYIIEDLSSYLPKENYYDAVGLIFLHLSEKLREQVHLKAVAALNRGGVIILESYSKEQVNNSSGGPKDDYLLYSLEEIFSDFSELEINIFSKEKIELNESAIHNGTANVIRYMGVKM